MNQNYHFYDDDAGTLTLANGRTFQVNPRRFCSVDEAVEKLTTWAQERKLIQSSDSIVAFV